MTNVCTEQSPWFAKLAELVLVRFGAPMVMLLTFCYAAFRFGLWAEQKIITPFWVAHVEQMQSLTANLETQTEILQSVDDTDRHNTEILQQNQTILLQNQQLIQGVLDSRD